MLFPKRRSRPRVKDSLVPSHRTGIKKAAPKIVVSTSSSCRHNRFRKNRKSVRRSKIFDKIRVQTGFRRLNPVFYCQELRALAQLFIFYKDKIEKFYKAHNA